MAPRVEPVTADSALPARVDVVIIGGGIDVLAGDDPRPYRGYGSRAT